LDAVIAVLSEELFEVSCGVIEGALIGGSSGVLPAFAESPFSAKRCRMKGGQPGGRRGAGGLGEAVQPAHWMVSVKSFTATSMSSGVFKEMGRGRWSAMRRRNRPQSVR
jgi:hypothetical protein